jgi:hypothetical protein
MPDITMCRNNTCPLQKICKRHPTSGTTPYLKAQSWALFEFKKCMECERVTCVNFWKEKE